MKSAACILLVLSLLPAAPSTDRAVPQNVSAPIEENSFVAVNVFIDPRGLPLAAYQFELSADSGTVSLTGIEGGEHPAYAEPPYYDPRALLQKHVIVAAYSTAAALPTHDSRVARLMVEVRGSQRPHFAAHLQVAATADGTRIPADIRVTEGVAP